MNEFLYVLLKKKKRKITALILTVFSYESSLV